MIKLIGSAVAGAAMVAGSGYQYVSTQNAKIEAAQRAEKDARADADADKATLAAQNAAIDHIMMELRDLRGVNAR